MKLNIFSIPKDRVAELRKKFTSFGLTTINSQTHGHWQADFYFSQTVNPIPIKWVETYAEFFDGEDHKNLIYFSAYVWESPEYCFVISYGKSHFYLRQFCDHDFGTEIAKRIADSKDIRQKSSKKFAGKKKKEIRSYTKNSQLDIESGESIDYLQSSIIDAHKLIFGKSGKFGSSVLLNPEMEKEELPAFLDSLVAVYKTEELFKLPRTLILESSPATLVYEEQLVEKILTNDQADFTSNSHELVGIDFIFSGQEQYKFMWRGNESDSFDNLSLADLNEFISSYSIPREDVLEIRVRVEKEDNKPYNRTLKECLDYIVDGENVILSQGKWMQFNEDYLDQLDEYVDAIDIETTEDALIETTLTEPNFSLYCLDYGYEVSDKDFSIIKVKTGTLVEAWDLKKGDTVYALKFGTYQKLGYVCDQSINTIELLSKKANRVKVNPDFKSYCVWIGVKSTARSGKFSNIKSIIFKQKLESWARTCRDVGIMPKLKITYSI